MLRGVWQALNCLFIHATWPQGRLQEKQKCGLGYVKTSIFLLTVVNYTIFAAIIDSFMYN